MGINRLQITKNCTYNGEVYGDNGKPYGVGVFSFADSGLSFETKCDWYKGSMVDFDTIKVVESPNEHRFLIQIIDDGDGAGRYIYLLGYFALTLGKTNYIDMELLEDRSNRDDIQSFFEVLEINNEGIKVKLNAMFSENKTESIQFIKYGECLNFGRKLRHTNIWEHDVEFETKEKHKIDIYLFQMLKYILSFDYINNN